MLQWLKSLWSRWFGPPAPPPYHQPSVGINAHMLRPEDLTHLRLLNLRYIRVPAILQKWEKDLDNYRAVLEDMNRAAEQNQLRLLWVAHNVVDDTPASSKDRSALRWVARMSEFCAYLATLSATEAIQPWNEVNGYVQQPFGAADKLSPGQIGWNYGEALRTHALRIEAVNPRVKIVSAGLARLPGWQECFQEILHMAPGMDAYAVHPYGPWDKAREMLLEARRLAGPEVVWATEFGNDQENRASFDAQRHIKSWSTFLPGNAREGLAARSYGYSLQTDGREEYSQHGLFELDGVTPRATYYWLRDYPAR